MPGRSPHDPFRSGIASLATAEPRRSARVPDQGDHRARGLSEGRQAARARPDGDGCRQDLHRDHAGLPPAEARRLPAASCFSSTPGTLASRPSRSSWPSSPTTTTASSRSSTTSSGSPRLTIAGNSQVVISTIQRMYATLKGEELVRRRGRREHRPRNGHGTERSPFPSSTTPTLPPE